MVQATDHKSEQMICSLSMPSQIPGIIPNANMCTLFISMVQQPKLSRKVVLLILSCISFVPNGVWDKKLTAIMEEDGTKKQVSSFYISGVEGGSVSFHFLGEKKKATACLFIYLFTLNYDTAKPPWPASNRKWTDLKFQDYISLIFSEL